MAQFVSKGQDFFACLSGRVLIDNDRAMIDKLWSKPVEAWFPGGKTDPNLALLRFDIDEAELWEADMSLTGKLKMLFGGKMRADEEGSHAKVTTRSEEHTSELQSLMRISYAVFCLKKKKKKQK